MPDVYGQAVPQFGSIISKGYFFVLTVGTFNAVVFDDLRQELGLLRERQSAVSGGAKPFRTL